MARIQILELPDEEGDDGKIVTPFALIIDQYDVPTDDRTANDFSKFRSLCGARAIFVTETTMDVPGLTAEEIATINRPITEAVRSLVDAVKPPETGVYVGEQQVRDIVRTELAENTQAIVDSLSDGRA